MSGEKCRCRDCERVRDRCYCRQCERGRDRCREKTSEGRRRSPEEYEEKTKESSCSNIIIQKYSPDCEKSSCDEQPKHIEIHNDHIIYITIR